MLRQGQLIGLVGTVKQPKLMMCCFKSALCSRLLRRGGRNMYGARSAEACCLLLIVVQGA